MRRLNAERTAAAFGLAVVLGGCTAVLGLDDKVFVDEVAGPGAGGAGGAGGGSGGAGGGGAGGGSGGAGGGAGGAGGSGGACPVVEATGTPGQSLWVQTSTSSQPASSAGVAVDRCGDVWVVAKFKNDIKVGSCPVQNSKAGEAIVWAKLDGAKGTCKKSGVLGGETIDDFAVPSAITVDSAGNAIIVGAFKGYLGAGEPTGASQNGSYDPFVFKLDPDGSSLWLNTWGSNEDDGLGAVAIDPSDDSIVVAGSIVGSMEIDTLAPVTLVSAGSSDVLLAKLDKDGFSQWALSFGSLQADAARGVTVHGTSGAIGLTGTFTETISFFEKTITTAGAPDVFAAGIDSTGTTCSFAFTPNSTPSASGLSAAWTGAENKLAVVGELNGSSTFGGAMLEAGSGDSDSFLALLDPDPKGTHTATRIGQSAAPMAASPDRLEAVAAFPGSKDVLIAGSFRSTVAVGKQTVTATFDSADILVARLDESFTAIWARAIGNTFDDGASAAAVDPATGAPVIGGQFSGTVNFGAEPIISASPQQIFVLKLAP